MVEMCETIKLDGSDYRSGRRVSGKPYCGFLALAGIDRKGLPDTNLFQADETYSERQRLSIKSE